MFGRNYLLSFRFHWHTVPGHHPKTQQGIIKTPYSTTWIHIPLPQTNLQEIFEKSTSKYSKHLQKTSRMAGFFLNIFQNVKFPTQISGLNSLTVLGDHVPSGVELSNFQGVMPLCSFYYILWLRHHARKIWLNWIQLLHLSLMAIFPRSLKPPSEWFAILVGKKETDLSQQKRILSRYISSTASLPNRLATKGWKTKCTHICWVFCSLRWSLQLVPGFKNWKKYRWKSVLMAL